MEDRDEKYTLRSQMRSKRREMTEEQAVRMSGLIREKLCEVSEFKRRKRLYIYIDHDREVVTKELIREELIAGGHEVFVPRSLKDRRMEFYRILDLDRDTAPGSFGISEPLPGLCRPSLEGKETFNDEDSVIIIPGLAFDKSFNRIGYGGGYYDTFLKEHMRMYKIALCFDFQIVDGVLPNGPDDVRVDMIISERRLMALTADQKLHTQLSR